MFEDAGPERLALVPGFAVAGLGWLGITTGLAGGQSAGLDWPGVGFTAAESAKPASLGVPAASTNAEPVEV